MTQQGTASTTTEIKVSAWRRWFARRQLRIAARLFERAKLTKGEYGALVVEAVANLSGESVRREEGWFAATLVIEAGFALGVTLTSTGAVDWKKYGPIESAVFWLGECFPVSTGDGDLWHVTNCTFRWGEGADRLLRRAKRRISSINRTFERADAWRGEQTEIAPNLHGDVWKLILALMSGLLGFLLGRFTAR